MAKIKICGLSRDCDIDYVNEAAADFAGFVFAESRRKVSVSEAEKLRKRLCRGIVPVGVFVNAPQELICSLYNAGIIAAAQLHGKEDAVYRTELKKRCAIQIIQAVAPHEFALGANCYDDADYLLVDGSAGSGKAFDRSLIEGAAKNCGNSYVAWFLAGGITTENIFDALEMHPFGIDVSSGAETDGVKDRKKILALTEAVKRC
ncbi:MAG: phosphoribosylanthranilate isomerase [Spirochaetaceae bacterium]|jgi:phosphoribosylanthranilate isomerase|nr:phosphoribosylanthranilate isomerase [Spirochaetaceae bacterium]